MYVTPALFLRMIPIAAEVQGWGRLLDEMLGKREHIPASSQSLCSSHVTPAHFLRMIPIAAEVQGWGRLLEVGLVILQETCPGRVQKVHPPFRIKWVQTSFPWFLVVFFVSLLRCFLFLTSFSLDFSCVSLLLGCVEVLGTRAILQH